MLTFSSARLHLSDIWEDSDAGLHSDQQKQQLPDISSGCSPPLQVRSSSCCFYVCVDSFSHPGHSNLECLYFWLVKKFHLSSKRLVLKPLMVSPRYLALSAVAI